MTIDNTQSSYKWAGKKDKQPNGKINKRYQQPTHKDGSLNGQ